MYSWMWGSVAWWKLINISVEISVSVFRIEVTGSSDISLNDSVTTAWRLLRCRMEERPPDMNKQLRIADIVWSSGVEIGRGANNPSP
jgi:hypothetical protein